MLITYHFFTNEFELNQVVFRILQEALLNYIIGKCRDSAGQPGTMVAMEL